MIINNSPFVDVAKTKCQYMKYIMSHRKNSNGGELEFCVHIFPSDIQCLRLMAITALGRTGHPVPNLVGLA